MDDVFFAGAMSCSVLARYVKPCAPPIATYHRSGPLALYACYTSPEQVAGLSLRCRSDVSWMAVTLSRVLAGRLPFHDARGKPPLVVLAKHGRVADRSPRYAAPGDRTPVARSGPSAPSPGASSATTSTSPCSPWRSAPARLAPPPPVSSCSSDRLMVDSLQLVYNTVRRTRGWFAYRLLT